jgi:hypothetical protein
MWIPFLLIIGVIAVVASSSASARGEHAIAPSRQLAPPGPISVLGEFVRVGQVPPPPVILCAIAEAELLGRCDLASDIVRTFVAPVVHQHELANVRSMHAPRQPAGTHARGSCALPRSARDVAPLAQARRTAPVMPPMPLQHAMQQDNLPEGFPASDEEIRALLDSDPERFMEMALRATPVVEQPLKRMIVDAPGAPSLADTTGIDHETMAAAASQPIEEATKIPSAPSPLANVPNAAWQEFCQRLVREAPNYQSARHVGQYRQRRERLAELGINPNTLGSVDAQRTALDVDLADAHRHATDGGLLDAALGHGIAIPGREVPETITLSGVLGVIQCAGLEGAASWLENQRDRKRFPHTTQAFLRTNGVF